MKTMIATTSAVSLTSFNTTTSMKLMDISATWMTTPMTTTMTTATTTTASSSRTTQPPASILAAGDLLDELNFQQRCFGNTAVVVILMVVMMVGVTGNSLVLAVYGRMRTWGGGAAVGLATAPSSPAMVYILVMAALDVVSCLITIPYEIWDLLFPFGNDNVHLCRTIRFVSSVLSQSRGFMLLCVAIDRYCKICHPLMTHSPQRAKLTVILVLVSGVALSWPVFPLNARVTIATHVPLVQATDCNISREIPRWVSTLYHTLMFAVFVVCFAAYAALYGRMFCVLWREGWFKPQSPQVSASSRSSRSRLPGLSSHSQGLSCQMQDSKAEGGARKGDTDPTGSHAGRVHYYPTSSYSHGVVFFDRRRPQHHIHECVQDFHRARASLQDCPRARANLQGSIRSRASLQDFPGAHASLQDHPWSIHSHRSRWQDYPGFVHKLESPKDHDARLVRSKFASSRENPSEYPRSFGDTHSDVLDHRFCRRRSLCFQSSNSNVYREASKSRSRFEASHSDIGHKVSESNICFEDPHSNTNTEVSQSNICCEAPHSDIVHEVSKPNICFGDSHSEIGHEVSKSNMCFETPPYNMDCTSDSDSQHEISGSDMDCGPNDSNLHHEGNSYSDLQYETSGPDRFHRVAMSDTNRKFTNLAGRNEVHISRGNSFVHGESARASTKLRKERHPRALYRCQEQQPQLARCQSKLTKWSDVPRLKEQRSTSRQTSYEYCRPNVDHADIMTNYQVGDDHSRLWYLKPNRRHSADAVIPGSYIHCGTCDWKIHHEVTCSRLQCGTSSDSDRFHRVASDMDREFQSSDSDRFHRVASDIVGGECQSSLLSGSTTSTSSTTKFPASTWPKSIKNSSPGPASGLLNDNDNDNDNDNAQRIFASRGGENRQGPCVYSKGDSEVDLVERAGVLRSPTDGKASSRLDVLRDTTKPGVCNNFNGSMTAKLNSDTTKTTSNSTTTDVNAALVTKTTVSTTHNNNSARCAASKAAGVSAGRSNNMRRHGGKRLKMGKTTLMLAAVTLSAVLSFLPYLVAVTLKVTGVRFKDSTSSTGDLVYVVCVRSWVVANVANPFIYFYVNPRFRSGVRRVVRCACWWWCACGCGCWRWLQARLKSSWHSNTSQSSCVGGSDI